MKRSEDADARTDGGDVAPDGESQGEAGDRAAAFRSDTDFSMSRLDHIRELYDRKFYAPVQIMISDYRGILGVTILGFYILMGTVGVAIVPRPEQTTNLYMDWFQNMEYPLGTDGAGRDLLGMVVHATPDMLQLMLGGAIFSLLMSVAVGTIAGYKRGMTDRILMTIADTALTLPGLPLLIIIVAVLEPTNPFLLGVILSVNAWAGSARSLRGQVLQIRNSDHVEATRAMGISAGRNIQKNVLPELLPLIALSFMSSLTGILFAAVGLYFLGILPTVRMNWGVMLNAAVDAANYRTFDRFHYLVVTLVTISVFGLGVIYIAQAFDRVFNPRLRAKHSKTIRGGGEEDDDSVDASTVEAMTR